MRCRVTRASGSNPSVKRRVLYYNTVALVGTSLERIEEKPREKNIQHVFSITLVGIFLEHRRKTKGTPPHKTCFLLTQEHMP